MLRSPDGLQEIRTEVPLPIQQGLGDRAGEDTVVRRAGTLGKQGKSGVGVLGELQN
jgi:hypothetical protein